MTKITKHDPEFNQERLTEWDKGYNKAAEERGELDEGKGRRSNP